MKPVGLALSTHNIDKYEVIISSVVREHSFSQGRGLSWNSFWRTPWSSEVLGCICGVCDWHYAVEAIKA